MGRRRRWPTCHYAARDAETRDAETKEWLKGRCPFNVRVDDDEPSHPSSLIFCEGCVRSTCFDCDEKLRTFIKKVIAKDVHRKESRC